jgi:hypothetical protein
MLLNYPFNSLSRALAWCRTANRAVCAPPTTGSNLSATLMPLNLLNSPLDSSYVAGRTYTTNGRGAYPARPRVIRCEFSGEQLVERVLRPEFNVNN